MVAPPVRAASSFVDRLLAAGRRGTDAVHLGDVPGRHREAAAAGELDAHRRSIDPWAPVDFTADTYSASGRRVVGMGGSRRCGSTS